MSKITGIANESYLTARNSQACVCSVTVTTVESGIGRISSSSDLVCVVHFPAKAHGKILNLFLLRSAMD